MKYNQYLLIKLAEEAAEVSQAAIKCSLFGYESTDPRENNGETNFVKLGKEMLDMCAVIDELYQEDYPIKPSDSSEDYIQDKRKKLKHYYDVFMEHTADEYTKHLG